ncbi:MAG TPA: deoxynucleoside kinase [Anaerolineales bacterium]|nr:deoxynucleoside kinase [Anaerolineales bacterium]
MTKLISIVGNVGVGKTTAAKELAAAFGMAYFGESHDDRPFQHAAKIDPRFLFHNQVNFYLERAKQEEIARIGPQPAVFDGGLDIDFHIFTKLFFHKKMINQTEFNQLSDLYQFFRRHLPFPDRIIYLTAQQDRIRQRYMARDRINLADSADIPLIQNLLDEYINTIQTNKVLFYSTNDEDKSYSRFITSMGALI